MATKIDKSTSGGIISIVHDDVSPGTVEIDMGKLEDTLASSRTAYGFASDLRSVVLSSPSFVTVDSIDERIDEAISKRMKGVAYSDSFYAHVERAKKECLRKRIEADTIIIDRGIAVSEGVGHAKMVMGLKVKYAKEGSLPMGAAFVMLETTPEEEEETERGKKEGVPDGKTGSGIIKRSAPGRKASSSMFIYYTKGSGAAAMVNVNHIVDVADRYRKASSGEEWYGLELTTDATSGTCPHRILIRDKEEAKEAWDILLHAGRSKV